MSHRIIQLLPRSKCYLNDTPQCTAFVLATAHHTLAMGKMADPTDDDAQQVFLYDTPRCTGACSAAVYQKVYKTAAGNAIVAMMGTVPGYFFTVAFVDVLGRIPIQFGGVKALSSAISRARAGRGQDPLRSSRAPALVEPRLSEAPRAFGADCHELYSQCSVAVLPALLLSGDTTATAQGSANQHRL